jgi:cytochrome P450
MTTAGTSQVYWDPYTPEIMADPYPVFRRLRDEAPLYYNEQHDFYAVSRYDDVDRGFRDVESLSSSRGSILELIKANLQMAPGQFIFQDPPGHTKHRGLLSRVFTPKKMEALEPQVRAFCARTLDPLIGSGGFDFVADLAADMPMRVIGMLLGIPEEHYATVREETDDWFRTEPGKPKQYNSSSTGPRIAALEEYLDWRIKHPSDDLMTQLLQAEFEDDDGTVRHLNREETLSYINLLAGAGNETTTKLIGWAGKVLGDHPDQRRELVAEPRLIRNAVEEVLRFESPSPWIGRYVRRAVEFHGRVVPEASAILLLSGSSNHDERRFPNGDSFDIHRNTGGLHTFGYGVHFCLGAALARLEGRVAIEEVLKRFPDWEVDMDNARLANTSTVRGWESLPVIC